MPRSLKTVEKTVRKNGCAVSLLVEDTLDSDTDCQGANSKSEQVF